MESVELDRLIERRARQNGGQERPEEVMYAESVRRYNAARDAERRAEWCEYHQQQAARLRRNLQDLVSYHEGRAAALQKRGRATVLAAAVNPHPVVERSQATGRGVCGRDRGGDKL